MTGGTGDSIFGNDDADAFIRCGLYVDWSFGGMRSLFADVLSRFSNEMLAVVQSDSMRRVQRDSSLVSWCRILSFEWSSEPRHRACPAQRRLFWRSADIVETSMSYRTQ